VDHDGPSDPRSLVGNRDRRLLGRHAAEQHAQGQRNDGNQRAAHVKEKQHAYKRDDGHHRGLS